MPSCARVAYATASFTAATLVTRLEAAHLAREAATANENYEQYLLRGARRGSPARAEVNAMQRWLSLSALVGLALFAAPAPAGAQVVDGSGLASYPYVQLLGM